MLFFAFLLYNTLSDMKSNLTWHILFLWWYNLWFIYAHTHTHFIFLKQGLSGPAGPPGPRGLPGNVVSMHWCICFSICALISLFNVFSFPFHEDYYEVQKAVFHYTCFLWLNWKIWRHLGMAYPWNTLTYSFYQGEEQSCFIPHQIVKNSFCCQLFKRKNSMFIVSLVLFSLPCFHLSSPFVNMTSWYKNSVENSHFYYESM